MPLFGKKKSQPTAAGGYPKQAPATQPYPQQPTAAPYPTNPSLPLGAYPTTSQNAYPPVQGDAYPQTPPPGYAQSVPQPQGPPPQHFPPQQVPPQAPQVFQPQPTVMGQFDPGARFDSNKPVNIPPPPPGVAPTAAQMAAAQGRPVVMTKGSADAMMGSDGGYTWY